MLYLSFLQAEMAKRNSVGSHDMPRQNAFRPAYGTAQDSDDVRIISFDNFVINYTLLVVGQFGTGQFGTRQFGTRTIWHQDNLAPDNLAPGQFGTNIIKTDNLAPDNLAPGQFGTNIIKRTIWHQEKNDIQIIV